MLQGVTGGYKGLQAVRSGYKGLKEVTRCYRGFRRTHSLGRPKAGNH